MAKPQTRRAAKYRDEHRYHLMDDASLINGLLAKRQELTITNAELRERIAVVSNDIDAVERVLDALGYQAPIVREEAASMDAEGNKYAAEDKAASKASRTDVEKADDAGQAISERSPLGSAADAMTTMTEEEARALADRPSRSPNLSAPDANKAK